MYLSNSLAHLTWGGVSFTDNGVKIILSKTTTIQCNERNLQFLIPVHSNRSVCLYTQLKLWFDSTPHKRHYDPVFLVCHLGSWVPLTRSLANPSFKSSLTAVGANASSYGWSSFRRGGATTGFIATGDIESLRKHGDWSNNAYTRYLALPASQRTHIVSALQNVLG